MEEEQGHDTCNGHGREEQEQDDTGFNHTAHEDLKRDADGGAGLRDEKWTEEA